MKIEDFTFFCNLSVGLPWPPFTTGQISNFKDGNNLLEILTDPDGSICIDIIKENDRVNLFKSQKLIIIGQGAFLLMFSSNNQKIEMRINDHVILPYNIDSNNVKYIPTKESSRYGTISIQDHNKDIKCADWITYRKLNLGKWERIRPGRVPRSPEDVLQDLIDATTNLKGDIERYESGNHSYIKNISGNLRSLICWSDGNHSSSYTPLLLRIAARYDLALPVYDRVRSISQVPPISNYSFYVTNWHGGIQKLHPLNMELMDIQESLKSICFSMTDLDKSSPLYNQVKNLTINEVLIETANQLGGAHYDAGINEILDLLIRNIQGFHPQILIDIANVIVLLNEYVIETVRPIVKTSET